MNGPTFVLLAVVGILVLSAPVLFLDVAGEVFQAFWQLIALSIP